MAAGKPVITTPVGIARELDSSIGFFAGNGNEAAKAIKHLYKNRKKAKAIGDCNRETAKKYGWGNIIEDIEKIYKDLAGK